MKLDIFTFYESLDDLPIKNYNLLQKYALIDLGIGSDLSDVVRHHTRFNQLLEVKDYESLYVENENLMINYNFLLSEALKPEFKTAKKLM